MWKVFYTNMGWFSSREGRNVEEAVRIARDAGFQATITDPKGEVVATFCPTAGVRFWARSYAA